MIDKTFEDFQNRLKPHITQTRSILGMIYRAQANLALSPENTRTPDIEKCAHALTSVAFDLQGAITHLEWAAGLRWKGPDGTVHGPEYGENLDLPQAAPIP